MKYFIGIDPGKTGGLAFIHTDPYEIHVCPMGSLPDVANLLQQYTQAAICFIEKAQAMPKQGVSSMFNYGVGYGELLGALTVLKIPFVCVPPQTWTKKMHQGIAKGLSSKAKSMIAVQRLFPKVSLLPSDRCKVPHTGMVDSLLIAEYGRLWHSAALSDECCGVPDSGKRVSLLS